MIKDIFEWFILAWTTLLVLLISGWILIEFYEWKIEIIVGIIAFVGAVIGGMITWVGVGLTIKSNRSLEIERINKEELMYLYPMQRELEKIEEHIFFEVNENHLTSDEVIRYLYKELSFENKMYDYAQRSSGELYNKLYRIKDEINSFMDEIYYNGEVEGMDDRELFAQIQLSIRSMIKDIELEINSKNNFD